MSASFFTLAYLFATVSAAGCSWDSSRDYFEGYAPIVPSFATGFRVDYGKYYKVLKTVNPSGGFFVTTLSVCGAPLPSVSSLGLSASDTLVSQLSAPLATAGIGSQTYLPYFELLGLRSSVTALPTNDVGPCVMSALASGAAADVSVASPWGGLTYDTTKPAAVATSVRLRDNWGTDSGKDLILLEYLEKTALGVAEWVAFVGAAFDKEAAAARVVADAAAAYDCAKRAVAARALQVAKPKVLWVTLFNNAYGGWFIGSCPNYYCGLVADAGGEFLAVPGGSAGLTSTAPALLAAFAAADVIIYANNDWAATLAPNLPGAPAPPDADLAALLAKAPAVANKRVFDIWGLGTYAWFELRPGQPALTLGDVAVAVSPSAALPAPTLLRNVITTPAGVGTSPLVSLASCGAPLPVAALNLAPCGGGATPSQLSPAQVGGIAAGVTGAVLVGFLALKLWGAKATPALALKTVALAEGHAAPANVVAV